MTELSPTPAGWLRVTLVRSSIGKLKKQKVTLLSMGLRKVNSTVDLPDNASTRGMVQKVHHLVRVDDAPTATE